MNEIKIDESWASGGADSYAEEPNLYSVSLIVKSVIEANTMEEAEKMLRRDMHAGDIDDWCVMATDTKRIYE